MRKQSGLKILCRVSCVAFSVVGISLSFQQNKRCTQLTKCALCMSGTRWALSALTKTPLFHLRRAVGVRKRV